MHIVDIDVVNINCFVFVLIQYIDYAILIRMEILDTKYIFSFTIQSQADYARNFTK